MDVVAESVIEVYQHRDRITGLEMTHEPVFLRFFQARFRPLAEAPVAQATGTGAGTAAALSGGSHRGIQP